MLIKIAKFNKDLNIIIDFRQIRMLLEDYFNIERVHV